MNIENGVFLVSGGASGLGAATCEHLVAHGGTVVIADRNETAGAQLQARLGSRALFISTDVTNEDAVAATVNRALDTLGPLSGAVCCAGVAAAEKLIGKAGVHRASTFIRSMNINVLGTFNMLRLAAVAMVNNTPNQDGERGVIITTASVAAFDGQVGQTAYAASKGAIVGMTLPAARELATHGIRVMSIAPGIFDTPLLAGLPDAARASLGQQVPFPPRLGRPPEYAALVGHIIENPMLNGEVIRLDGAIRMAPK